MFITCFLCNYTHLYGRENRILGFRKPVAAFHRGPNHTLAPRSSRLGSTLGARSREEATSLITVCQHKIKRLMKKLALSCLLSNLLINSFNKTKAATFARARCVVWGLYFYRRLQNRNKANNINYSY